MNFEPRVRKRRRGGGQKECPEFGGQIAPCSRTGTKNGGGKKVVNFSKIKKKEEEEMS